MKDKKELEWVQRHAARFVMDNPQCTSSITTMIKELGWPSLENRHRDIRLALFYKSVYGLAAIPVDNILIKVDQRNKSHHPTSSSKN